MPYFVISVTGYIIQIRDVEFFLQCILPNLEYKYTIIIVTLMLVNDTNLHYMINTLMEFLRNKLIHSVRNSHPLRVLELQQKCYQIGSHRLTHAIHTANNLACAFCRVHWR